MTMGWNFTLYSCKRNKHAQTVTHMGFGRGSGMFVPCAERSRGLATSAGVPRYGRDLFGLGDGFTLHSSRESLSVSIVFLYNLAAHVASNRSVRLPRRVLHYQSLDFRIAFPTEAHLAPAEQSFIEMITSSPSRSTARSKEHPQFDDLASSQSTTAPIEDNKERDILSPTDTLVGGLTPTGRDATRNAESASGSSKGNATSKDYEGDIELGRATAGTGAGTGGEGGEDRLGASLEEGVLGVGGQLEEHEEDTTPDGGYGWVIVGCMMWQNAVTWGECRSVFPMLWLVALQWRLNVPTAIASPYIPCFSQSSLLANSTESRNTQSRVG